MMNNKVEALHQFRNGGEWKMSSRAKTLCRKARHRITLSFATQSNEGGFGMSYHLTSFKSGSLGLGVIREAPDGARTLCLAPVRGEDRLGEPIPFHSHGHPQMSVLDDAIAPLVARFASLVFTENNQIIEPLLEQLRWLAIEYGIDHVVLPLWPESQLADDIQLMALAMGLPADFILTQDEQTWPHNSLARYGAWEQRA